MAELVSYKVARAHLGDEITDEGMKPKNFDEGDTRRADPTVVASLVNIGVLVGPKGAKADADPANKAEPEVKNKTEKPAKDKENGK